MRQAAHDLHQEFWSPPAGSSAPRAVPSSTTKPLASVCSECGTEFVVGARFCHVCGGERTRRLDARENRLAHLLDLHRMQAFSGLSLGPLIALVLGVGCVLAAIATGMMYTTTTLTDWQAVQLWRIQWLLGAAAAFLVGILLKKSG